MNKMREIMKKGMAMLLVMVMLIVAVPTVKTEAAVAVKLNKTKTVMYLASTQTIRISGTSIKRIATGNSKIATVRKTGSKTMEVRARKAGSTVVGIRGTNGKLYTCKVTVLSKKAPRISVARQVALYKARFNSEISNGYITGCRLVDINGDGVYEFSVMEFDGAKTVYTIDTKNRIVKSGMDTVSENDIYRTSKNKIIRKHGSGMGGVESKPSYMIWQYDSKTGTFRKIHEFAFKYDSQSYDYNYYVDGVQYSTYIEAIAKFRSYYISETLREIEAEAIYKSIDEAYRHRK